MPPDWRTKLGGAPNAVFTLSIHKKGVRDVTNKLESREIKIGGIVYIFNIGEVSRGKLALSIFNQRYELIVRILVDRQAFIAFTEQYADEESLQSIDLNAILEILNAKIKSPERKGSGVSLNELLES